MRMETVYGELGSGVVQRQDSRFWFWLSGFESLPPSQLFPGEDSVAVSGSPVGEPGGRLLKGLRTS